MAKPNSFGKLPLGTPFEHCTIPELEKLSFVPVGITIFGKELRWKEALGTIWDVIGIWDNPLVDNAFIVLYKPYQLALAHCNTPWYSSTPTTFAVLSSSSIKCRLSFEIGADVC